MINVDQDTNKQSNGVWTSFRGSKFLIAHSGNDVFQRAMARLQAPHRKALERGNLDPVDGRNILCVAMTEGLVLDWKDVNDKDGKPVPYSKELCVKALKNNDDLREFVQNFSTDLQNFRDEEVADKGKL